MKKCKLVPIGSGENLATEDLLSKEVKCQQLNKIIAHRLFSRSPILCKFLSYVVNETLAGNANQIKEYTIAINVLNKPKYFDTQQNGVVRIHASRLRRSLTNYYRSATSEDAVIISIPKGQYKPIFQSPKITAPGMPSNVRYLQSHNTVNKENLAILPFNTYEKISSRAAFIDSIGQRLSNELNKTINFSVVSYSIIKELGRQQLRIKDIAEKLKVKYILSGDVHFESNKIRVFAQLLDTTTLQQIWSDIYDLDSEFSGYFELSDLITSKIISSLRIFISNQTMSSSFSSGHPARVSAQHKQRLHSNY